MMDTKQITDRIEKDGFTPYIQLNTAELEHYTGAGQRLVSFENGQVVEMAWFDIDIRDWEKGDRFQALTTALAAARKWLATRPNTYLAMCSCTTICHPEE